MLYVNDFHTSAVHHRSGAGIKSFNMFRVRMAYVHVVQFTSATTLTCLNIGTWYIYG